MMVRPGHTTVLLWLTLTAAASSAGAAVDLELRPTAPHGSLGSPIGMGLYAVLDGNGDSSFSVVDVVMTWDPLVLELTGVDADGPHPWFLFGFLSDELLDGLNADCGPATFCGSFTGTPYNDGNAYFQAASISNAEATTVGMLIATFTFNTLTSTFASPVTIEPALGATTVTQVFAPGGAVVTGMLRGADAAVFEATLSVEDLTVVSGRSGLLVVSGTVVDTRFLAVTIAVELQVPLGEPGVFFTPAADASEADIQQLGDPWPGRGLFSPFDTAPQPDGTGSLLVNGSVDENGTFRPEATVFSGPLTAFPLVAEPGALGEFVASLDTGTLSSGWNDDVSGVLGRLASGVVRVVELNDADGSGSIDTLDFAGLQNCFTGDVATGGPPVFPLDPALRCHVFDGDDDGDVDWTDFEIYRNGMSGPQSVLTAARSGFQRFQRLHRGRRRHD
ncbi:MAG: hypothetical protein ACE5EX_02535 [Phycisphaerae bacterium]